MLFPVKEMNGFKRRVKNSAALFARMPKAVHLFEFRLEIVGHCVFSGIRGREREPFVLPSWHGSVLFEP